jgi:hypothetical protein
MESVAINAKPRRTEREDFPARKPPAPGTLQAFDLGRKWDFMGDSARGPLENRFSRAIDEMGVESGWRGNWKW